MVALLVDCGGGWVVVVVRWLVTVSFFVDFVVIDVLGCASLGFGSSVVLLLGGG